MHIIIIIIYRSYPLIFIALFSAIGSPVSAAVESRFKPGTCLAAGKSAIAS